MSRRDVFSDLISKSGPNPQPEDVRNVSPPTRAIKGMTASLKDLQKAAAQDIPVDQIMDSVVHDRIDLSEGIEALMGSLERDGQEVPIKVRMASGDLPFEVVVGRRRLAAARKLGWKHVRGFVVEMDDKAMLRALTTENTGRLETSFIGRSQLASLAISEGNIQTDVAGHLGVSQSLVNFMLRVYRGIGPVVISAIGDAPGVGRKKWQILHRLIETNQMSDDAVIDLLEKNIDSLGPDIEKSWQKANQAGATTEEPMPESTKRFEVLHKALKEFSTTPALPPAAKDKPSLYLEGQAQSLRKGTKLTIKGSDDILDYIEAQMPEIMEAFTASKNR